MNRRTTVAPDIAARVRAVAEELRYRPSDLGRNLSLGRTRTVALVVPDLANPVFQQVLRGAVAAAEAAEHRVLVAETAERPGDEAEIAREARSRCDALLLAAPRMPETVLRDLLPELAPVVLVNRTPPLSSVPAISVDHAHGISRLVDHLVGLGHRDLAYVTGPPSSTSSASRARALEESVLRHEGIRVVSITAGSSLAAGFGVADEVLDSRATAVLAFNDLVAFGLVARLNEIGVSVPDDLSVTGFDDIELARFAIPPLTTAGVDQAELGRRSMARLLALVAGTEPDADADADVMVPRLAVRASTGPVPPSRRRSPDPAVAGSGGEAQDAPARWDVEGTAATLRGQGTVLAHFVDGSALPRVHSPRPFLHPVHSLAGAPVTLAGHVLHRHQQGASFALPDVDGTSHWGGRTYVPGQGPTLLLNHGRQDVQSLRTAHDGASLLAEVGWHDENGTPQLHEERRLSAVVVPTEEAWVLGWRSVLHAPRRTTITSPAVQGRPQAGFGGVFWRLATADETHVLTPDARTERGAYGATSPWLAFVRRHGRSWSTVVLVQDVTEGPALPWFVRATDYAGAGPALSWDTPLVLEAGADLAVGLVTVVVDRRLDAAGAAAYAGLGVRETAAFRG